jgi:outer membrane protein OmpA-like peptidoglycan-associated protein/tetratricopeptide (TPR) repeat protein
MNNKLMFLLGVFMCFSTLLKAQNKATQQADQLYNSYQYVKAIEAYKNLAESKNATPYIYTQLANCYYQVFNNQEAAKWFSKAVASNADAEVHYKYAQTLKVLGNYVAANKQMDIFATLAPKDSRALQHKNNPNYIADISKKDKLFDVGKPIFKNDGKSDFGAVLSNYNDLYFTSNRNANAKKEASYNQSYLDIYKATRNSDGSYSEPTSISELNSSFHDGPVTISADGATIYFSRDGQSSGRFEKNKAANVKIAHQGLYKATKTDGKWKNITSLPFNNPTYSVTNPSLSQDGKTLYFASDMPGGFGKSDIWKVAITENGYGTPENLGSKINTADKENFPFIAPNDVLYFASTGKQGLGGLDIYKIDLKLMDEAQNLGKPVNSEKDDFSFSYNTKYNTGFFSSNRTDSDIIYSAIPICKSYLNVTVTDKKTGGIIENALVSLIDNKGNSLFSNNTDRKGKAQFDINCSTEYQISVASKNHETATYPVAAVADGDAVVLAKLAPLEVVITEKEILLNSVYFEYNKSNITAQGAIELDKLVKVLNENPLFIIFVKSHTDSKGSTSYNLKLSEQRAQSTVQYIISKGIDSKRISGKGFGSSELKVSCGNQCTEEQHALNRRSEFLIVKK